MDVSWCATHQSVGLLYHGSHIQVVPVVKEILKENQTENMSDYFMEEGQTVQFTDWGKKVVTSKSCFWEQSSRGSRQQVI